MATTIPLAPPPVPVAPHSDTVMSGPAVPPQDRIKLYSADEWEAFVEEWAYSPSLEYSRVERCGGPGDMGRDVIAFADEGGSTVWDNFQCKHYDHPLHPGDVWTEIGKLAYYTLLEEFPLPRRYTFVSPFGVGTSLSNLLRNAEELRTALLENWDKACRSSITSTKKIALDEDLRAHIKGIDFAIFDHLPPLRLIDQHRSTPYHLVRFGGGLPARPECSPPPHNPSQRETVYLRKLFDAYGEHLDRRVRCQSDIEDEADLREHHKDSRVEFYSAEALRSFSRDTLPEGAYEKLQDEIHGGVRDIMRANHDDGYRRVIAVTSTARSLQLTSHALVPRLRIGDRGGICHQLANEREDVKWVR